MTNRSGSFRMRGMYLCRFMYVCVLLLLLLLLSLNRDISWNQHRFINKIQTNLLLFWFIRYARCMVSHYHIHERIKNSLNRLCKYTYPDTKIRIIVKITRKWNLERTLSFNINFFVSESIKRAFSVHFHTFLFYYCKTIELL